jgi:hypothetical protein
MLTVEQIARVAHEANRAYCTALGEHTVPPWDLAPVWQKDSLCAGVSEAMTDPNRTPEQSHAAWVEFKRKAGWTFGKYKRPEALQHPCLVPWDDLPDEQKVKDVLFLSIVNAISGHVVRSLTVEVTPSAPLPPAAAVEETTAPGGVEPKSKKRGKRSEV